MEVLTLVARVEVGRGGVEVVRDGVGVGRGGENIWTIITNGRKFNINFIFFLAKIFFQAIDFTRARFL